MLAVRRCITTMAFGAFGMYGLLGVQKEEKAGSKTKASLFVFLGRHISSRTHDEICLQEHLPSSHVHLAVDTPQCHDSD